MSKNKYEEFEDEFEDDDDNEVSINWAALLRKLYRKKKLLLISAVVTLVVATPLVLTIPKYYTVEVKLAPEFSSMASNATSLSGISKLMNSFGFNTSQNNSGDAIMPNLYPDLMNSTSFQVSLFSVPVETKDGKIKTTYYDYLENHQKTPIWNKIIGGIIGGIMSLFPQDEPVTSGAKAINAGRLTKKQSMVVKAISTKVICDADTKTGVISIVVKDQDPVVCTIIADSTCQRLQEFITEYRSKKTRKELANVERQYAQAKVTYEQTKQAVESYNNSHWNLVDQSALIVKQDLQNKMSLAFSTMSTFNTQRMAARSKYQSSLPVFTVLDNATVPIKPAGPKRSIFIIGILFLVLGSEVCWILAKDKVKESIAKIKAEE